MLLAGDVGGTKTLLGLFSRAPERPRPIETRQFTTLDFPDLGAMITEFISAQGGQGGQGRHLDAIEAACFGVAGPVRDQVARLTNVPWLVDAAAVADRFAIRRVRLLNDLEAMSHAVPVFEPDEVAVLEEGEALPTGNAALIAPGTGLGEALLHNVDGRFVPAPSEGGHADFAARTPREIELLRGADPSLRPCPLRARHLGPRPREHLSIRSCRHRVRGGRPEQAVRRAPSTDFGRRVERELYEVRRSAGDVRVSLRGRGR